MNPPERRALRVCLTRALIHALTVEQSPFMSSVQLLAIESSNVSPLTTDQMNAMGLAVVLLLHSSQSSSIATDQIAMLDQSIIDFLNTPSQWIV